MDKRPRIDLDGLSLHVAGGPSETFAILRYRTTEGIILALPESVDVLVSWKDIERADLCLQSGRITLSFTEAFMKKTNWLGSQRHLEGRWIDRLSLQRDDVLNT